MCVAREEIDWFLSECRSPQDDRLHIVRDEIVKEVTREPVSAFDQMNLFDNTNDVLKRIVRSETPFVSE